MTEPGTSADRDPPETAKGASPDRPLTNHEARPHDPDASSPVPRDDGTSGIPVDVPGIVIDMPGRQRSLLKLAAGWFAGQMLRALWKLWESMQGDDSWNPFA